ncbi:hypothetical protein [Odoribacter laneus]|uniref:DinB/UmuC family translesion DNA polymerase n=1 Tax=Odoribacter laneus TaxID=626933 RepID=UPI003AB844B8
MNYRGSLVLSWNFRRIKSIYTSRSFAEMLTDYSDIQISISNFTTACSRKFRKQNTAAAPLIIFLFTNRFRPNLPQYYQI